MLKDKNIKLILLILLIIIIAGIVTISTKGMNYGLNYGENTMIETYLDTKIENAEIKNIVTETFGKKNSIRTIEDLDSYLLITVESANEEQINTLVTKINEKYNLDMTVEDLEILNNPKMSFKDLINPYLIPTIIASLIIIIYFVIKYRRLGIVNILKNALLVIIGIQLAYISIYAITRIPVNELTMPISAILFILSFIVLIEKYEGDINSGKEAQK